MKDSQKRSCRPNFSRFRLFYEYAVRDTIGKSTLIFSREEHLTAKTLSAARKESRNIKAEIEASARVVRFRLLHVGIVR